MFKRLGNIIKGFFSLFIGGLEKKNPEALLENEKENLRKQIAEFNKGLASHAGLVERLITRVKKLNKEEDELRAKTAANLKAGNRALAGELALKLKKVDSEHEEVSVQMEDAEKRYKELTRARDVSVKEARVRIEGLRRDLDDLKVQKAMAELNEMAAGMVSEVGGSGETLNRLEEMVEEERTKAAGRSRVARDSVDLTDVNMKESEQAALAEMALADFAAAEGIELEKDPAAGGSGDGGETTKSTMGPESTTEG
jgi:phage shock protein A